MQTTSSTADTETQMHTESLVQPCGEIPAARFENVSRRFGKQAVLESVSFDVCAGECFGLVGGNGAGKTTLLKCMLDFIALHGGRIDIWGTPHAQTRARSGLAFLPERFVPPYYLTGADFLRYMLSLHGTPYDAGKAQEMLASMDLPAEVLTRAARTFSKGMTQKLGLAACFLSGKMLLLLDEPASGLDPKARMLFKAQIRIAVAAGRSVFMTSHSLADVDEMCHRMAVLHQGRLRYVGTPADLRERYNSPTLEAAYLTCIDDAR